MSLTFPEHAILWLHIVAAIFTIGPGTAAIMSTPRYIRDKNTVLVGYLLRTTRVYSAAALLVLIFGLILTAMEHKFTQWWISVSLTLFVVAVVLLLLIMRDQRRALSALVQSEEVAAATGAIPAVSSESAEDVTESTAAAGGKPLTTIEPDLKVAAVERGRIASMGGVTALIWVVILVMMVWR
jgi:Ca2+/Na+ antiporter